MNKKILITSALPYVNNVPHLGNLIGAVLSADVFARFSRSMGKETLYICGSDEHGTATQTKAKEEGITPQELCDKFYTLHKNIYEWFNISFDIFGRSSLANHKLITQDIFKKVLANGYIEEDTTIQPYSVASEMFLADRFIIGTCPYCHSKDATGDQCDACGKLLTPIDLIDPKAKMDGTTPEFRETKHLFLKLDTLQPLLEKWVEKQSIEGKWSENATRTTKAWFKEGLKKRAISRDLKWGIPIPYPDYENKVFYVWFDAPIAYISLTQQLLGDAWSDWWQSKDIKFYQFMGKDNIPFHSIIFPATLMAASKDPSHPDYHLVDNLSVTEYLNYENTQFSKSRKIGIFGDQAIQSGVASDVFRYTLLFYRPESSDTQFTWKGLQERLNNELIGNFGNFINRTLTFSQRFFEGKLISLDENKFDEHAQLFLENIRTQTKKYVSLLEEVKLRDALMQMMKISSLCNQFFQEAQPWKTRIEQEEKAATDISILIHCVKDLAIMCEPYMPHTSKEIFKQINTAPRLFEDLNKLNLGNHAIGTPSVLFIKLEDEDVDLLRSKYGGSKIQEPKKEKTSSHSASKKEKKPIEAISPFDVQFRVGQITSIKCHPDADKLYIEEINLGEKTIEIISGLVPYYSEEELLNKKVFVVENLKPAKMRGIMSYGMLLAAENSDGGIVEVLDAANFKIGASFSKNPKEQIKFGEFMTLTLDVKDHKVFINEKPFLIGNQQLSTQKIVNGKVH